MSIPSWFASKPGASGAAEVNWRAPRRGGSRAAQLAQEANERLDFRELIQWQPVVALNFPGFFFLFLSLSLRFCSSCRRCVKVERSGCILCIYCMNSAMRSLLSSSSKWSGAFSWGRQTPCEMRQARFILSSRIETARDYGGCHPCLLQMKYDCVQVRA